jgi:8-amino-7-oxononanoate synthase
MKKKLHESLKKTKKAGLYRALKQIENPQSGIIIYDNKEYINFSSNNYMGLASDERLKNAMINGTKKWGTGSGSSRLVCGNLSCYSELEASLSSFKHREASLVYPTGYMANTGLISSLAGDEDAIIIDRLNHASIIDGARLSKAKLYVYKHCDADSLEATLKKTLKHKCRLVVTDSIFSMDGDAAPLNEITKLCEKYDASLIVDEAHATGIFGEKGCGLMSHLGLSSKAFIDMGTFSKALGSLGGFISSDSLVRDFLINTSRSLIYTTALPPGVIETNIEALKIIAGMDDERKTILDNSKYLKTELEKMGYDTLNTISQIIPVVTGDNKSALSLQKHLEKKGFFAPAIRFPTVPKNAARIRISLTCLHTRDDVNALLDAVKMF